MSVKIQKTGFFFILLLIVLFSSGIVRLILFLIGKEEVPYSFFDFLNGMVMPVLLFFFDKKTTRKTLILTALLWPVLMSLFSLLL